MKHCTKRILSVLMALCMILSLAVAGFAAPASEPITTPATGYTKPADVPYDTTGTIANWGARGETCTFLSTYAKNFYTGAYTYAELSKLSGGTSSTADTSALYIALNDLMVSNHKTFTTYGSDTLKSLYAYTDCVSGDTSKVSLLYQGTLVDSTWDSGATYNQEHVWPQSKLSGSNSTDIGDIMHLRPADPSENSSRGNQAYGESEGYYDPGVSVRGDVARTVLYMYTRWGNTENMWGTSGVMESEDILLKWIAEDPVDTWEMGRNDAVQSITGTRNVFVDYPELAYQMFSVYIPEGMVTPSSGTTEGDDPATDVGEKVWDQVAFADIASGDTIAITMTKGGTTWVLPTTGEGSNGQPMASYTGTIAGTTLVTDQFDLYSWTFTAVEGGFHIQTAAGDYLYLTNTNNGVRIGSTAAVWTVTTDYLSASDGTQARYLGVYNSQDWRCYKTITTNIAGEALNFWRLDTVTSGSDTCEHTYDAVTTDATCTANGSIVYTCTKCGDTYVEIIPVLGHSYAETVTTAPTCTTDGEKTITCATCGDTSTEIVEALGHDYVDGACSVCGEAQPATGTWNMVDIADITSSDTIAITMSKDGVYYLLPTTATSTAPVADITGTVSGTVLTTTEVPLYGWTITSTGSGYYIQNADGQYLYLTATNNGVKVGSTEIVWSITDGYLSAVDSKAATRYLGVYLTKPDWRCYTNTTGNTAGQTLNFWKLDTGETVCDHTYGEPVINDATCNEDGSKVYTCTKCGETNTEIIPATGHSYTEEITTAATCESDGLKTLTCACGDVKTEAIPATGHNYVDGKCTECGEAEPASTTWTKVELADITASDVIAITMTKDGVTWALFNGNAASKAPTAVVVTVDGTTMTSESVFDLAWNIASEESGLVIYQLNTTAKWLYSTTSNNGIRVGTNTNKYWNVEADYGYLFNVATSRYMGVYNAQDWRSYTSMHANISGQTLSFWKLDGELVCEHDYVVKTTDPTCTETGTATYTCSICNLSYTEELPVLGHKPVTDAGKDATCTETGLTEGSHCETCGEVLVEQTVIDILGHSYVDGKCSVCGVADPDYVKPVVQPTLTLNYPSLSFESEIVYNVYFTPTNIEDVVEMGLITFASRLEDGTIADAVDILPNAQSAGTMYMAQTKGIAAKYMGDALYFKVYAKLSDGSYAYSAVAGYNAIAYTNTIFKNSQSDEMKALCVAMLNYGAEAQKFFGHNVDSLMNAGLTAGQQALVSAYDASMVEAVVAVDATKTGQFVQNKAGFTALKPTVSFEGAFAVNYYFSTAYAPENGMTMYYWTAADYAAADVLTPGNATGSMAMEPTGGTNEYWGAVSDIAAKKLDETIYVTAVYTSGGTTYCTGVIAYHIGRYCQGIAANDSSAMQDLAAATATYGYYAKSYFASISE